MNAKVIDAPPARLVFRADPLAAAIVPLLFALIGGGVVWLTEGRVYAQWVCAGIAVFALIDQVQLRLRPPLEVEGGRATARPRRGGAIVFGGESIDSVTVQSHGIFGRGVIVRPGLNGPRGATSETFIGPLRDPTGAWHALDRLRRTGGQ
jgi:hypothetical protein